MYDESSFSDVDTEKYYMKINKPYYLLELTCFHLKNDLS